MRDKGNLRLRLSLLTHAFASGDIGSKVRFAETEGTTRRWGPGEARPRREIESRDPIGGDRNGGGGVGRIDPRRVRVAGCRRPHRSPPRRREPGPHRRRATERPPATPPPSGSNLRPRIRRRSAVVVRVVVGAPPLRPRITPSTTGTARPPSVRRSPPAARPAHLTDHRIAPARHDDGVRCARRWSVRPTAPPRHDAVTPVGGRRGVAAMSVAPTSAAPVHGPYVSPPTAFGTRPHPPTPTPRSWVLLAGGCLCSRDTRAPMVSGISGDFRRLASSIETVNCHLQTDSYWR